MENVGFTSPDKTPTNSKPKGGQGNNYNFNMIGRMFIPILWST
jgi:hypothetical protein